MLVREREFTVDLLMLIVALVTLTHGIIVEGLIVLILYAAAELIEGAVEGLARRRVEGLLRSIPRKATVVREGRIKRIDLENVRPGDEIIVSVGDTVPVDGSALSQALVDLSIVTGESEPVDVSPGDTIPSGATVIEGPLRLRASKRPDESFLQSLVNEALEALEEKPGVTRLLERLAPAITAVVIGLWIGAYFIVGPKLSLAILLAGCPSAFIIGSSFSASLSVARLARHGVLSRGGSPFEKALQVDTVVIDKTGTLTELSPAINGDERLLQEIRKHVAPVAAASRHPVSKVFAALGGESSPEYVREIPGKGIVGVVQGVKVAIMQGPRLECGRSVRIMIGDTTRDVCLTETPTPWARRLVEYLKANGLKVVMASGDKRESVERIARILGIDEYYGEMKPHDKALLIEKLQKKGRKVMFIGDGVNDTLALAKSYLGVAVGTLSLTSSVADITAPGGPKQVLEALEEARNYRTSLYSGFITAAGVKILVALLGLTGALSLPLVALLGDDGSTLVAVAAGAIAVLLREKLRGL